MTLKSTKQHLIQLLENPDNKVVALSGRWGTGKSHLWDEIKNASQDKKINSSLYVSLFGLATMDQVKLKIVQSAIPGAKSNPDLWERANALAKMGLKAIEGFHKSFSALNELALLLTPSILKDNVIVLDDIERKHRNLSIDEVMGFIDELTQQHKSRVLLILNINELKEDREMWDRLREKVIDQEIRLSTSPEEAFQIAFGIVPCPYEDWVRKTVEICGITNIRVVCKVLRTVNRIVGMRENLSNEMLARVIPSTVLLAAVYFKGIDDGPDLDFVLKIGLPDSRENDENGKQEIDDDSKLSTKWRLLIQEIGIVGCDEYEQLVVEFLKSGLYDVSEVSKIIERYASEAEAMKVNFLAREFHEHVIWHYRMSEEELLIEAHSLAEQAHLLSCYDITGLCELLSKINGGSDIADLMLDNWIAAFMNRNVQDMSFENYFHQPIHARIEEAFQAAQNAAQAKTNVFEACKHIAKNRAWGHTQEAVMRAATPRDFETTIKSLDVDDLKLFMLRFLEMCEHPETYKPHFGSATDHFIDACRNICSEPDSGRLGDLIKLLFKDAKLESKLVLQ